MTHADARGSLTELFRDEWGTGIQPVQWNASHSAPNVLRGVRDVDLSVQIMGQSIDMPVYCSPTALQRLFHHTGEFAVAAAACDRYSAAGTPGRNV